MKEELQSSVALVPVAVTVAACSSATAWFRSLATEALRLAREHVRTTLRTFPVSWPNVAYSDSGRTNMCRKRKDSNSTRPLVLPERTQLAAEQSLLLTYRRRPRQDPRRTRRRRTRHHRRHTHLQRLPVSESDNGSIQFCSRTRWRGTLGIPSRLA
eukprot:COSAG02_NODE_599_length_19741_cov_177.207311_10_plen_156_part_00